MYGMYMIILHLMLGETPWLNGLVVHRLSVVNSVVVPGVVGYNFVPVPRTCIFTFCQKFSHPLRACSNSECAESEKTHPLHLAPMWPAGPDSFGGGYLGPLGRAGLVRSVGRCRAACICELSSQTVKTD